MTSSSSSRGICLKQNSVIKLHIRHVTKGIVFICQACARKGVAGLFLKPTKKSYINEKLFAFMRILCKYIFVWVYLSLTSIHSHFCNEAFALIFPRKKSWKGLFVRNLWRLIAKNSWDILEELKFNKQQFPSHWSKKTIAVKEIESQKRREEVVVTS